MERHFEIWGGRNDDLDSSAEFLETIFGPGPLALAEAIRITKDFQSRGYYAYIRDMDDDGKIITFT